MLTVTKVLVDETGTGRCGRCEREHLKYVSVLSDGTQVGGTCARKILGWTPGAREAAPFAGMTVLAEHTEHGQHYVLWGRGGHTRTSRNGALISVGGQHAEWQRAGWL